MSRIDDALKRLAGVVTPEPIAPSVLERFAPEDSPSKIEDALKGPKAEVRKLAAFVPSGLHPVDARPVAPRVQTEPSAPRWSERPVAVTSKSEAEPEPEADPEVETLIDVRQIFDYAGFVVRSIGRHKRVALATFLVSFGLTVAAALLIPKTYYVQVKLLAQRNAVMAALSNPGRAVPWDADAPTRAAAETVLRRDNLILLINQTDLLKEWEQRRAPILKLKDWLMARLVYEPTADDKLEALVWRLENYMFVSAGPVGDGTVTIELFWPDAEMGYQLVERAKAAFLEARQSAETSAISESIAILERYSASLHDDVNKTLTELQRTQARERAAQGSPRSSRGAARRPALASAQPNPAAPGGPTIDPALVPDPELARLRNELTVKRQEVARLEESRERQISDLQARLATLQTVYTATHPSVLTLQQNIAAFQHESPQIVALKSGLEELEAQVDERSAADAERLIQAELSRRPAVAPTEPSPREAPLAEPTPVEPPRNEVVEFASLRLRTELGQLQSILERTDGARIELAVSEAAFKYRYTMIKPAQVPREPSFPNLRLVIIAGFLASLLLAVGVVVGTDLISNRILEPWQLERQLGVPILGNTRIA
jgi:uncharacterized protein involved in exopolysaccharide biosynthesis